MRILLGPTLKICPYSKAVVGAGQRKGRHLTKRLVLRKGEREVQKVLVVYVDPYAVSDVVSKDT